MTEHKPIIAVVGGMSVESAFKKYGAETFNVRDKDDEKAAIRYADGIAFTGGGDVNPERYGDTRYHPNVYGVSDDRDEQEFRIVRKALKRGVPMFGICRGLQVLNVAHGGTLHQDIEEFDSTLESHGVGHRHEVILREGAGLTERLKAATIKGTSIHHQAIRILGLGLEPVAWSPDGIVEAIESAPGVWPYVLATQFHPEMDHDKDADAANIFQHFIEKCAEKAGRRKATFERLRGVRAMRFPGGFQSSNVTPITPSMGLNPCPHGWIYQCTKGCNMTANIGYDPKDTKYSKCKHGFTMHFEQGVCDFRGSLPDDDDTSEPDSFSEFGGAFEKDTVEDDMPDYRYKEANWRAFLQNLDDLEDEYDLDCDSEEVCAFPPCPDANVCDAKRGDCLNAAIAAEQVVSIETRREGGEGWCG